MARVWFVRRLGGQWIAPGGAPAFELPLTALVFPLDLGVHRTVPNERPAPAPELPREEPALLQRVFVEVEPHDLDGLIFTGYAPGIYDSPYSPREATRRLSGLRAAARPAA
jgi:hypothetical protein